MRAPAPSPLNEVRLALGWYSSLSYAQRTKTHMPLNLVCQIPRPARRARRSCARARRRTCGPCMRDWYEMWLVARAGFEPAIFALRERSWRPAMTAAISRPDSTTIGESRPPCRPVWSGAVELRAGWSQVSHSPCCRTGVRSRVDTSTMRRAAILDSFLGDLAATVIGVRKSGGLRVSREAE